MRSPRENSLPQQHEQQPYGEDYFLLGLRAVDALWELCDVPNPSTSEWSRWTESDHRALHGGFSVEEKAYAAIGGRPVPREQFDFVEGMLSQYRMALPFDEAEREWLWHAYDDAWGPDSIDMLRQQEARIISVGLQRVILGRDLVRRWWAWRRETEEYAGRGSLDIAREALREVIETVSPSLELPAPYLTLRGQNLG